MTPHPYAARYAEAQISSVDRKQLLLLVFDGGLRFLHGAREALAANDIGRFSIDLSKAQAIISELAGTLDHEAGGELAAELARLYEFMLLHLTEANVQKSVRHIDEVHSVLATIAGAYREVIEGTPESGAR